LPHRSSVFLQHGLLPSHYPTPWSPGAAFGNGFSVWNVHFRLLLQQDTRVGNGHGFQVSRDVRLDRSPAPLFTPLSAGVPSIHSLMLKSLQQTITAAMCVYVFRLSVVCLRLVCTHPEWQCTAAAHAHPYTRRDLTFLVEITILRNLQLKSFSQ